MTPARLNRRRLLQGVAASSVALPAMGTGFKPVRTASAQAVELEFWTPANDPVGSKIITDLAEGFNSTIGQEKGIHVNTRIKPTTGNNYVEYTTAMTSSGSPDVVMTYIYNPVISWAANGFIRPIDEYAEAVGIKEEDFFPITWSMISFAGHIWGLMQEFDFDQFWTNKKIHSGDSPKTIEELDNLAKDYTTQDSDGNLTQAGFIPWLHWEGAITGYNWNAMFGGRWYDVENRKWTINTPENQAMMEWFIKYADLLGGRDKSDAFEASVPKVYGDIFQSGVIAFAQEGEYVPPMLKASGIDLDFSISHAPTAGEVPFGTAVTSGGNLFLLPTNAPHPEEAAAFIQYMGSGDAVLAWCLPNSNFPPTKAAATDPKFTEQLPLLKPWYEALLADSMVPPSPSPQLDLFNQEILSAVDVVTYKQKSPDEALSDVAAKIADGVKQFQASHPEWEGE
jgi:ABC-type glycerol-3-phosphate transport system substrate-binding protein